MAVLFDTLLDMAVPATSSWEEIDLSVAPYNLPPTAVGIIAVVEMTGVGGKDVGLRMKGSTDDIYNFIYLDEMRSFFIGCDVSQVVECYSASTDSKFWLAGYFDSDDVAFYADSYDKTPGITYAWSTRDLPEISAGLGLAAIFYVDNNIAGPIFGVRKTGSTDNFHSLFSLIGGAISAVYIDTGIAYCDFYIGSFLSKVRLVGYLKRIIFKENILNVTPVVVGSWTEVDLSADSPVDAGSAIIFARDVSMTGMHYGLRSTASGDELYHKADMINWQVVKLDVDKKFQAKIENFSNIKLYVVGYLYGTPPIPPVPTPTNSELMRHLRWFYNGVDMGCYTGSR